MKKLILLLITHGFVGAVGFAAGVYFLPILIAPPPPPAAVVEAAVNNADFSGTFKRDLQDSDFAHWGEGDIYVGDEEISLRGTIAPGPDYKLYLSPQFVETEADFNRLKSQMARVGDVKTFENFVVSVPANINPADYKAVVIWCESFSQFITAASYQ